MKIKHINITVSGRVQGVWFRKHTQKKALSLGITGTVCNLPNGNVYIEAQGEAAAIDAFIAWCYVGSPLAAVKNVDWQPAEPKKFTGFSIV